MSSRGPSGWSRWFDIELKRADPTMPRRGMRARSASVEERSQFVAQLAKPKSTKNKRGAGGSGATLALRCCLLAGRR
eukprot:scaffold167143_cov27-Tisochrysis_lutea.AAC.1